MNKRTSRRDDVTMEILIAIFPDVEVYMSFPWRIFE